MRGVLTIIGLILALFVLAQIKTRSGFLVFLGTITLCLAAPLFTKQIGRKKVIVIPIGLCVLFVTIIPFILEHGAGLIDRFTNDEYFTLRGRINSFLYLFEKLVEPAYWVPQGNAEFFNVTGSLPHSNITAVYLEGGILGLYMWISIVLVPTSFLFYYFLRGRLTDYQTMFVIGAIASFVIQMSLNAPLHEHVWLWSGVACGTLNKVRVASKPKRKWKTSMVIARSQL
jgi:hypothetical protein